TRAWRRRTRMSRRRAPSQRRNSQPALDTRSHDRGIRTPQRARRPPARSRRRQHGRLGGSAGEVTAEARRPRDREARIRPFDVGGCWFTRAMTDTTAMARGWFDDEPTPAELSRPPVSGLGSDDELGCCDGEDSLVDPDPEAIERVRRLIA